MSYSHPPYGFNLLDHFAGPVARLLRIQTLTDSFLDLPFLLRGTNLVGLVQERLGQQLQAAADIRLLECPIPLMPLHVSMWWHPLYDKDQAHSWLRTTLVEFTKQGLEEQPPMHIDTTNKGFTNDLSAAINARFL